MNEKTEEKIINEVMKRHEEGAEFKVTSVIPEFRDGELAIVSFSTPLGLQETFIYIDGDDTEVYTRTEELVRAAILKRNRSSLMQDFGLDKVLDIGGIAGFIAIIIALTICGSFIQNPSQEVPDVLSNALTVILGFYFGSKVSSNET